MTALRVQLGGVLGRAITASHRGRLFHFITGTGSPAIALFDRAVIAGNFEGDWYGEHAGKWLVAASRAAARSGDAELRAHVHEVADFLVAQQQDDGEHRGYLGTYAPPRRFMVPQPPKPVTWDGAPSVRTWDIWTHSYLILGLLEAHRQFHEPRWLQAARRIGDLCWRTLHHGGIDITDLGNHHGMSATVLMDPAAELYAATGEQRYLDLALLVLEQANAEPRLALLPRALAGVDAFDIATGKAYQLAWNLVGLCKLHRATGRADLRDAADKLWHSIRDHHLSLGGGPWGGAGLRSRECFNPPGVFDPEAYVETCSTLAWIQLNRELLQIAAAAGDGAAACRHADEIERSAYNDLLAAAAPDGEDWCYYVFPNGRRVHTTYWRCCKSSGAMALEELPGIAVTQPVAGVVDVNLYGPCNAALTLADGTALQLRQATAYPFDGAITLIVQPAQPARFILRLRCPAWADGAMLQLNGTPLAAPQPGHYAAIDRTWSPGDRVTLQLPLAVALHQRSHHNTQESRAPDGSAVQQPVLRHDYVAVTRGPLVYATGLVDGFKPSETVRLMEGPVDGFVHVLPDGGQDADVVSADASAEDSAKDSADDSAEVNADEGPALEMHFASRPPLRFTPWYRTGGRRDGAWRLTWLRLAPTDKIP